MVIESALSKFLELVALTSEYEKKLVIFLTYYDQDENKLSTMYLPDTK